MKQVTVERLVRIAATNALGALGLMVLGTLWPNPYIIVVVMSVGQLIGTLSFALFLFAIAMDLQRSARAAATGDASPGPTKR